MKLSAVSQYRKAIFAVVSAVITWVSACYIPDGRIDRSELFTLVVALAGALGVYSVSNDEQPPKP